MNIEFKNLSKRFLVGILLTCIFCSCLLLCACGDDETDKLRQQAIEHENYLLSQMETIENKYQITNRNDDEIVLQNYSLGSVSIYDTYGTSFWSFGIENQTVYHNWYSIQKSDDGIFNIKFETIDRQENRYHYTNNEPYIIHDRALTINLSPYNDFYFASVDGNKEYKNSSYKTENSYKITHEVKTNVTEFETTRILNVELGNWNSSHTEQFCTYEIQFVKIIFEDTTYNTATIMEYRFRATTFVSEELNEVFDSYNN